MSYPSRPDFYFGVAFNRDQGDGVIIPAFSEFTQVVRGLNRVGRGTQYELGLPQAGTPTVTFRDPDETLNPGNAAGLFAGSVLPYREILGLGQWPNGAAGNLTNLGTWRVPVDPSFDSYTAGQTVPWITAVGPIQSGPVIGTATPRSSPNCLTWTQGSGTNDSQGVAWQVPCIPGRQYTLSAYVKQSAAVAEWIGAGGLTQASDRFQRTVANGWGNAEFGGGWNNNGGAAGDYAVTPSAYATHTLNTVNAARVSTINGAGNFLDSTPAAYVAVSATAVGAALRAGVVGRADPGATFWYGAFLDFGTDNSLTLSIIKLNAGVETVVATQLLGYTYIPGQFFGVRLDVAGTVLRAKVWQDTVPEPAAYTINASDQSITGAAACGAYSKALTGNTNTAPVATFRAFGSVGLKLGTNTAVTGAYNRISVTFTATAPYHTASVRTVGAGTLGNVVQLDDVQHEQAAAPSAFTTSGPVIYPILRDYVERWPRLYDLTGREGSAPVPCIDALGALQVTAIADEVTEGFLALQPRYYWTLADGPLATQFAEVSGNNGPPLAMIVAKYGAGAPLSPATSIPIPGNLAASGVGNTSPGSGFGVPMTCLGAGQYAKQASLALPGSIGNGWAMSGAVWFQATIPSPAVGQSLLDVYTMIDVVAGTRVAPMEISLTNAGFIQYEYVNGQSGTGVGATGTTNLADGKPHLAVMTVSQATNGDIVTRLYVDGSLVLGPTTSNFSGQMLAFSAKSVEVGGIINPLEALAAVNGVTAHVAIWNRVLTAAEIAGLWTSGNGFVGETSGARVARHLALAGYLGAARISAGSTTMQAPTYGSSIDLMSDTQNTQQAELGHFWAAPDGAVVFEGRNDRFLRLVSKRTFGENSAGGEIPYVMDQLDVQNDPTYVYASVQVARSNGITAVGGDAVSIAAAARRYFGRPFGFIGDFLTDAQAQDAAHWIFYTHNSAMQRVAQLTIDPASNPALWPVAFGAEIGDRVTFIRRPLAANAGAGTSIAGDYFIENILHDGIDFDLGTWETIFVLSPIGAAPGPNMQPWILGDNTYSVLGSTTKLGV